MPKHTLLRPMKDSDLETVLSWRNHDSVRRFMYTQHYIKPDEHRHWFEQSEHNPNRYLMIYQPASNPLGFVNIDLKSSGLLADWGFYNAPDAPKGTGTELGKSALSYGFEILNLHKICGQALGFNTGSIKFHEKLGFLKEGVLRDQHFDGKAYHDIICFGLLQNEWQKAD